MTENLLLLGGGAMLLCGIVAALLLRTTLQEQRVQERLLMVQRIVGIDQVIIPWSFRRTAERILASVGRLLTEGGVLSARTIAQLEQTLMSAGFRGDRALAVFVGAKVSLLLALPAIAALGLHLFDAERMAWSLGIVAAAIIGLLSPDLIAQQMRRHYLRQLERGLPDALDLMVICSEAGLSLEGSIERVSIEIAPANRAVATEFALCVSELKILSDRRTALLNMADRTGLELLRRIGAMLAQTLQYGTPLGQALRALAAEMRQEQMVRFETRAARLPVLLTLPMVLCILPALFLVIGGPAIIRAIRAW